MLQKRVWNRLTPSERQWRDSARLAAVQTGKLDLNYLRDLEAARPGEGLKST